MKGGPLSAWTKKRVIQEETKLISVLYVMFISIDLSPKPLPKLKRQHKIWPNWSIISMISETSPFL